MKRRLCAWVFSTPTAPRISNAQGTLLARTQSGLFQESWRGGAGGQAILPPPRLVMASTEGRGGRSSLKSGQRVTGSLKVDGRPKPIKASAPSAPGCCTARNNVSPSGVKQGPHISAPIGTRIEELRGAAQRAALSPGRTARRRGPCAPSCRPDRWQSTAAPDYRRRRCRDRRTSRLATLRGSTAPPLRRSSGRRI